MPRDVIDDELNMPASSRRGKVEPGAWVFIASWKDPAIALRENDVTGAIECVDVTEVSEGRIKNNKFIGFPLFVHHVMPPFVHGCIIDPTTGEQHMMMLDAHGVDFAPLPRETAAHAIRLAKTWAWNAARWNQRRAKKIYANCDLIAAMNLAEETRNDGEIPDMEQ